MDSSSKRVQEMDNADKQLVKSPKSFLCEIRRQISESSVEKQSIHSLLDTPHLEVLVGDKAINPATFFDMLERQGDYYKSAAKYTARAN